MCARWYDGVCEHACTCVRASMRVCVWTHVRACAGTDTTVVDVESNGDGRAARVAGSAIEAD